MKNFCIIEQDSHEFHAGSKARNDAGDILVEQGWTAIPVHRSHGKGTVDKLKMAVVTCQDWGRVSHRVSPGDTLLIQYPLDMYPKVSRLTIPFLRKMKNRGVKLVYLIHDLDSLRGVEGNGEREFLELGDVLIAHNPVMVEHLCQRGYGCQDIRALGLFDYLVEGDPPALWEGGTCQVVVAGNLTPKKAGYLYQLGELGNTLQFRLYGPNYSGKEEQPGVVYCGQYPPEQLPQHMQGAFGLVWDGEGLDSCTGVFGEYLRYNNPHKTSLYLACGMPVIVWDQAAIAPYVVDHHLGIAVSSLRQLPQRLRGMTEQEYTVMVSAAQQMGNQLRQGAMLRRALAGECKGHHEVRE